MAKATITSPKCTVCAHEDRVLIDNLLASGADGHAVARRFRLGKDAPRRHYERHVSDQYKASVRAGPFGSEENLRKLVAEGQATDLETLRAYRALINSRALANFEVGADAAFAGLAKAAHDNIALHAKITGGLAPTRTELTINVMQDPRTVRFVTLITGLVRKYPQTRADVTALVRECFGEADGRPLLDVTPEAAHA